MDMSDGADGFGKVIGGAFGNADARSRTASSGSEILDAGQLLIAGMRLTTGWGTPDPGEAFGRGATGFTGAGQTVDSAYPRDDWAGTGSRAYASANRRQSGSAASLAVLDRDVQTVVAREAFQVEYHRGKLDDLSDHLSSLGYATWSVALIPGVGKALKAAVEMTAVNTALLVSSTELATLASETGENAAELRRLVEGYAALTRKTAPPVLDEDQPPPVDEQERRPGTEPATDVPSGRDPERGPSIGAASPSMPAPAASAMPPPVHCSPAPPAEATTAGQAAPPPTAADPMAAMSSVFGAVGGAIGSAMAPIAAALTGVVTAAGQALSTATSAQPAESTDGAPDTATSTTDEDPRDEPAEPAADDDAAEPTTPGAVAEPGEPAAAPPPAAEPPRPPAPAATRPPQ
ncbi:hypothetical protein MPSYJ_07860 [Mycolicibacterium psychrotolerans]|uniref:ESX-1 secretion-associated protein EspA/EspE-like domain-containing protein n=2 Tax=Mycolicibacterium psychrotolerans TaxID=216929 RepID=A0A7I7M555_9MYCO|nr:hypothetical protein MPSYJ_07860 [Mycolicibacterium psychrotolerans]